MWVVLKQGFFSAVEHHDSPQQVVVRARCRQHAENLAAATGGKVQWTPDADYCARVTMSKATWADFLKAAALDISYANVKDSLSGGDAAYHHAMVACWAALNDFQCEREGVGAYVQSVLANCRRLK